MADKITETDAAETPTETKPQRAAKVDELALARARVTELEAQLTTVTRDRDALDEQARKLQAQFERAQERPDVKLFGLAQRMVDATEAQAFLTLSTRAHTAGKGRVAEAALERAVKLLTPEG